MPIGHGFSFFGHGKVMENTFWKRMVTLKILWSQKVRKIWRNCDTNFWDVYWRGDCRDEQL